MMKLFKRDRAADHPSSESPAASATGAAPAAPDVAPEPAAMSNLPADEPAPTVKPAVTQPTAKAAPQASPPVASGKAPSVSALPAVLKSGNGVFTGTTSANFEPLRGVIGLDHAREALGLICRLEPRSAIFVAAPRSSAHTDAIRTLLAGHAAVVQTRDAVAIVQSFTGDGADDGLVVIRLPAVDAAELAQGVASAVGMLSATLPAAFDSDSYRVARIALDEELRSGHDSALDVLRRKALAQNVGLLRTTNGYAVVPMHDGRVVRGDVYGALPGSLKSGVEAKLATFEAELADILRNRAILQQDHYRRAKTLERDAASLAVDAALAALKTRFAGSDDVTAWLTRLDADLVANAQLFVAASRAANGTPRAPAEIAADPRLQRYRIGILSRGARGEAGLEFPETLDRAELIGVAYAPSQGGTALPNAVSPGALTRPGGGIVAVDVRDLMASYASWPMIKHALKSARAAPLATGDGADARAAPIDLPVEVRLVVLGEPDEYRSWTRLDPDVARMVRTIEAFAPVMPASEASERTIARHLSGFVRDDGMLPFDGPALAAVYSTLRADSDGYAHVSTDLTAARDLMGLASAEAAAASRVMVLADDVVSAMAVRSRLAGPLTGMTGMTVTGASA
ncbi:MAG: AAA family ATPase [Hyphomicrobiaceae bacterium]|nr:AAA family ATPase [Hyphomicrobiaceae bacterium]